MGITGEMGAPLRRCGIIQIPRFTDLRGSLSVIGWPQCLPFEPKRFYYIYDLVDGARRGCHAHKTEQELILALAGSFKVAVDDGDSKKEFLLDRPDQGLYIPPLVWHELHDFASGSVCAVLASELYNVDDYWCEYEEFARFVGQSQV
jgi:dTDP-4-dehydrorhamnose 3,5-epimerase-like enzyme